MSMDHCSVLLLVDVGYRFTRGARRRSHASSVRTANGMSPSHAPIAKADHQYSGSVRSVDTVQAGTQMKANSRNQREITPTPQSPPPHTPP